MAEEKVRLQFLTETDDSIIADFDISSSEFDKLKNSAEKENISIEALLIKIITDFVEKNEK